MGKATSPHTFIQFGINNMGERDLAFCSHQRSNCPICLCEIQQCQHNSMQLLIFQSIHIWKTLQALCSNWSHCVRNAQTSLHTNINPFMQGLFDFWPIFKWLEQWDRQRRAKQCSNAAMSQQTHPKENPSSDQTKKTNTEMPSNCLYRAHCSKVTTSHTFQPQRVESDLFARFKISNRR